MITTLNEWRTFINENKHQGDIVKPTTVYHKSNPGFRKIIDVEGLKPQKGDSYNCHSPENDAMPAIFGYIGDNEYDNSYDDDIWKIDTKNTPNVWYIDLETNGHVQTVMTYEPISRSNIELIYKGTGEPLD